MSQNKKKMPFKGIIICPELCSQPPFRIKGSSNERDTVHNLDSYGAFLLDIITSSLDKKSQFIKAEFDPNGHKNHEKKIV